MWHLRSRGLAEAGGLARTPRPPYFAVIFTSLRTDAGADEYADTAARMVELGRQQPGFLGVEAAREGLGITVSYWASLEAIAAWKKNSEHLIAQKRGRREWYQHYTTRIARVERDYSFDAA
mmetsp:Transcript_116240/g.363613  ORF Transcript_116240/g.363613 Transcript_116240/m.363613 type:complete len:121 (+) Transcript_116240:1-363(+)